MSDDALQRMLPGHRLKKAREAKGLTGQSVSEKLRLSRDYIKAIEADSYERLPEAAFVKGYLKNYARLVGESEQEIDSLFNQLMADDGVQSALGSAQLETSSDSKSRPILFYASIAFTVLIVLVLIFSGSDDDSVLVEDELVQEQAVALPVADDMSAEIDAAVDDAASGVVQPEPDAETLSLPSPPATVEDQLKLEFSSPCWVEVHDSTEERLVAAEYGPDKPLTISGQGPFKLLIGDGAAVSVATVNGEAFSVPARSGRVVRLTTP